MLLPASLIVDHPWTLRPTTEALVATVAMGIFSSAFGLMLFYMCLTRLGTLTTNAQGYLRIPIGVGLSVVLLGETVPSNLALGLVLVMAGVAAMTIPRRPLPTLDRTGLRGGCARSMPDDNRRVRFPIELQLHLWRGCATGPDNAAHRRGIAAIARWCQR